MALLGAIAAASSGGPARAALPDAPDAVSAGATAEPAFRSASELRGQPHALGRVFTAGPAPTGLSLLSTGGYGYTESVLGTGDAHHRWAGSLTVDGRPLPWLGLALRLDGRYDRHVVPGQPADTGLVGDPRLFLRVDRALGPTLAIGGRAGLWLPGHSAPSLEPTALSPDLVVALSYTPGSGPLTMTANLGYRVDRSARSATDARLYSASDRAALDVSAFDSVLVGGAASLWIGRAQTFLEGSWNLLVGNGHPKAAVSPIRVGGGVRVPFGPRFRIELGAEVSPSARPDLADPTAAPVPIPPRFAIGLGAAFHFGGPVRTLVASSPAGRASHPPPAPKKVETAAPRVEVATLRGRITAEDGSIPEAPRVQITGGTRLGPVAVDPEGRFAIDGAPGDELTISVEAKGFLPASETAKLSAGDPLDLDIALRRAPPEGQLRGFVRSYRGSAVEAEIRVDGGAELRASGGRFQIDVAPGSHEVRISAAGYETQVRQVQVEQNGVTLLNIDLRRAR